MNEEMYMIAKTIDTTLFYGGIVITAFMVIKSRLKGIERYKFAIQMASAFLGGLAIVNTYMTVYKYKIAVPDNKDMPVIAGAICVGIFAALIGILWLIYFIWKKKRQKNENTRV